MSTTVGAVPLAAEDKRLGRHEALVAFLSAPHYAITITGRCNRRCPFCFERSTRRGGDTPIDEIGGLLRQAAAEVPNVVFMGAESSLHREFPRVLARARELGLVTLVSTNLEPFADSDYLARCFDAGLGGVEFSFHYDGPDSYRALTGTSGRGWDRLRRAMDNLEAACTRAAGGSSRVAACANVVVSTANAGRLRRVVSLLGEHLPTALLGVTFKRLQLESLDGSDHLSSDWSLPLDGVRSELTALLDDWPCGGALPLLRGFPLCQVPGREHLHADLLYHCGRRRVVENFGRRPEFVSMYDYEAWRSEAHVACHACRLATLCTSLVQQRVPDATFTRIPSGRNPADVLETCPVGRAIPGGISADEARAFVAHLEERQAARESELHSVARSVPGPTAAAPPVEDAQRDALQAEVERRDALLDEIERRLEGHVMVPALAGYAVVAVTTASSGVSVVLSRGEDRLMLWVERRSDAERFFAATRDFAVSYAKETPINSESRLAALRALLRVLEGRS